MALLWMIINHAWLYYMIFNHTYAWLDLCSKITHGCCYFKISVRCCHLCCFAVISTEEEHKFSQPVLFCCYFNWGVFVDLNNLKKKEKKFRNRSWFRRPLPTMSQFFFGRMITNRKKWGGSLKGVKTSTVLL